MFIVFFFFVYIYIYKRKTTKDKEENQTLKNKFLGEMFKSARIERGCKSTNWNLLDQAADETYALLSLYISHTISFIMT